MPDIRTAILSNTRSFAKNAYALTIAALSLSAGGCALWLYDDPCGPPPGTVYVIPDEEPCFIEESETIYYAPEETVILGQVKGGNEASKSVKTERLTRGQEGSETPAVDESFPVVDSAFPSIETPFPTVDGAAAPPAESEVADFVKNGTDVPEPTGQYETIGYGDDFRPQPKRESLGEREKAEEEIEKNFDTWMREKKARRKAETKKGKRYLQPIQECEIDGLIRREESKMDVGEDDSIISTVTAESIELMLENDEAKRELYDWEKEEPTPIDWSKYAFSMDNIRAWFGMGPNERAALEYMRQACNKQKEYEKTHDKKCLREAAKLYEKAADRWPGPALRPDYAKKHPYDAPKSGTLIEEDGLFFAGECWFFAREYNRALACFRALVQTYTSSIYKDVAMKRLFYIGSYWMQCSEDSNGPSVNVKDKDKPVFNSFAGGEKAFKTIFLNDASDTGLAPDALFALANAYMRRGVNQGDGSFDSAACYYKQLYEFYPGNKHAEDASRLAMIALHKSYQGVFYDDGPLNEARSIAETILKSGRGNMDVVYEELENIKDEQAHRLYALGCYYIKRGSYASARSYFNRLVKEYPSSQYAVEGAKMYETIEDKPAEADQLAWIRPVMPFLPKSKNEFFEEAPSAELSKIARRDETLGNLGKTDDETTEREEAVAEAPTEKKRY